MIEYATCFKLNAQDVAMNQLFVNNLTVIDFSYFDNQRGILGESWNVDIVLSGDLDHQGMVFDFGHVKKKIKSIIDSELDHRFVITKHAKNFELKQTGSNSELNWQNIMGTYQHISPNDAILVLEIKTVNPKSIASYLEDLIIKELPDNITEVSIKLSQEVIEGAYYHYSHGLKKHDGNCQRIVHGHRSKIEIYENHQRNQTLEDYWSACFRNIYIGTREDISNETEIEDKAHITFSYKAQQGDFSVTLPKKRVYILDTDTTVELIADHIAKACTEKRPNNHYRVKAFEGIDKGSIATS
ncbi:MAG: 6-pyruvoyl-tetrahydropterin synthase [Pseudohongiellaceae bacterium]